MLWLGEKFFIFNKNWKIILIIIEMSTFFELIIYLKIFKFNFSTINNDFLIILKLKLFLFLLRSQMN
jgi:hypothetical protein